MNISGSSLTLHRHVVYSILTLYPAVSYLQELEQLFVHAPTDTSTKTLSAQPQ